MQSSKPHACSVSTVLLSITKNVCSVIIFFTKLVTTTKNFCPVILFTKKFFNKPNTASQILKHYESSQNDPSLRKVKTVITKTDKSGTVQVLNKKGFWSKWVYCSGKWNMYFASTTLKKPFFLFTSTVLLLIQNQKKFL